MARKIGIGLAAALLPVLAACGGGGGGGGSALPALAQVSTVAAATAQPALAPSIAPSPAGTVVVVIASAAPAGTPAPGLPRSASPSPAASATAATLASGAPSPGAVPATSGAPALAATPAASAAPAAPAATPAATATPAAAAPTPAQVAAITPKPTLAPATAVPAATMPPAAPLPVTAPPAAPAPATAAPTATPVPAMPVPATAAPTAPTATVAPATSAPTAAPPTAAPPTFAPTAAPTIAPTPAPIIAPTPAPPAPTAAPVLPAPPSAVPTLPSSLAVGATICAHFAANPMCRPLPSMPSVAANSGAWAAVDFAGDRDGFGSMNTSNGRMPNDNSDGSEPVDALAPGGATVAQVISCDLVSWGPGVCEHTGLQGRTLAVPAAMLPAADTDHHYSFESAAASGEYDFWLAQRPGAPGATMHVGGAGFCAWGGDGTACSDATATNIATSIGGVDAAALHAAESDPHGTLGYAVAVSSLCADSSYVYPANASDGSHTDSTPQCAIATAPGGRPPEGVRWYIDKSDADIDATANAPYVKVILRTMDREHFGGTIVDTNWSGAPGLSVQYHRGDFGFAANEAGVGTANDTAIPLTTAGIDLRTDVRFCTNGTC